MSQIERILDNIKTGRDINATDLKTIESILVAPTGTHEIYTAIHAAGVGNLTQFAPIIANYVFPQNKCLDDAEGTVSSISCRVLGYLWVLPEYFDIISCAAQHGKIMTRIRAAAALGRLANQHKHLKIDAISVILSEFQCAVTPSVKAAFYQALLEALDVPLTNRLTPNQILSFGDSDIQAHYLQLATDLTSSGK